VQRYLFFGIKRTKEQKKVCSDVFISKKMCIFAEILREIERLGYYIK
jgi:hypothetical protein